jgi:phosphate transport system substrate-binding protein
VHKSYDNGKDAAAIKGFCEYALTEGQKECAPLGYLPIPPPVAERALQNVKAITP